MSRRTKLFLAYALQSTILCACGMRPSDIQQPAGENSVDRHNEGAVRGDLRSAPEARSDLAAKESGVRIKKARTLDGVLVSVAGNKWGSFLQDKLVVEFHFDHTVGINGEVFGNRERRAAWEETKRRIRGQAITGVVILMYGKGLHDENISHDGIYDYCFENGVNCFAFIPVGGLYLRGGIGKTVLLRSLRWTVAACYSDERRSQCMIVSEAVVERMDAQNAASLSKAKMQDGVGVSVYEDVWDEFVEDKCVVEFKSNEVVKVDGIAISDHRKAWDKVEWSIRHSDKSGVIVLTQINVPGNSTISPRRIQEACLQAGVECFVDHSIARVEQCGVVLPPEERCWKFFKPPVFEWTVSVSSERPVP